MRVHFVSDVHGAAEDLPAAAEGADLFVCLGDLLLYLDYDDPTQGAFAEVFGADVTADYIALRTAKRFDDARALTAAAWERLVEARIPQLVCSALFRSSIGSMSSCSPRSRIRRCSRSAMLIFHRSLRRICVVSSGFLMGR